MLSRISVVDASVVVRTLKGFTFQSVEVRLREEANPAGDRRMQHVPGGQGSVAWRGMQG
jgi:hypothetical protein